MTHGICVPSILPPRLLSLSLLKPHAHQVLNILRGNLKPGAGSVYVITRDNWGDSGIRSAHVYICCKDCEKVVW